MAVPFLLEKSFHLAIDVLELALAPLPNQDDRHKYLLFCNSVDDPVTLSSSSKRAISGEFIAKRFSKLSVVAQKVYPRLNFAPNDDILNV
ncbi:MAG: hypothetical protein V2A61_04670 [Calditrichota bacterium]